MSSEYKKKFIALFISVIVCSFCIMGTQKDLMAEAQFQDFFNAVLQPVEVANSSTSKVIEVKEFFNNGVLKTIAIKLAQSFLDKTIQETVSWAYSGFKGKPSFVQNTELTYEQLKRTQFRDELDAFINKEIAEPTSYYAKQVVLGLVSNYTGVTTNPNQKLINTLEGSILKDKTKWKYFVNGAGYGNSENEIKIRKENLKNFWTKYSLSTKENNNLLGKYVNTQQDIYTKLLAKRVELSQELANNQGFQSQKTCLKLKAKVQPRAPKATDPLPKTDDASQQSTLKGTLGYNLGEFLKEKLSFSTVVNAQNGDGGYSNENLYQAPGQIAPKTFTPIQLPTVEFKQNGINPGLYTPEYLAETCSVYATTLPGTIVEGMLRQVTNTPITQSQQVDTWQDLLSYTVSRLKDEVIKQGVPLGEAWAKKKITGAIDAIKQKVDVISNKDLIDLQERAPEALNADTNQDQYITGEQASQVLITDLPPESIECLKKLGIEDPKKILTNDDKKKAQIEGDMVEHAEELIKLSSAMGECGFNNITKLENDINIFQSIINLNEQSIYVVRKLDVCVPGPDKGWEARFTTKYTRARSRVQTRIFSNKDDTVVNQAENFVGLLDSGTGKVLDYMNQKIRPTDIYYKTADDFKYRSLVNQSENLFSNKESLNSALSNRLTILERLKKIKEVWDSEVNELGEALTAQDRITLINEIYSYYPYFSDTGYEGSPSYESKKTVALYKQLKKSVQDCGSKRSKYLPLSITGSPIVMNFYNSINTDNIDENKDLEFLKQNFGSTGEGRDELMGNDIQFTLNNQTITLVKTGLGNSGSVSTSGTGINYSDLGALTSCLQSKYQLSPGSTPTQDQINSCSTSQSTTITYNIPEQYAVQTKINEKDTQDAIKRLNTLSAQNFDLEMKDSEIAYYCALAYNQTAETGLVLGRKWDKDFDSKGLSKDDLEKSAKSAWAAGIPILNAVLNWNTIKGIFTKEVSELYKGFSCSAFYFSKSINDYDPSKVSFY